jgi:hypothetical protein
MSKAIGLLAIVLAVWLSIELYSNGYSGAFGGIFASGDAPAAAAEDRSWAGSRAADKTRRAHDERNDAIDRLSGAE